MQCGFHIYSACDTCSITTRFIDKRANFHQFVTYSNPQLDNKYLWIILLAYHIEHEILTTDNSTVQGTSCSQALGGTPLFKIPGSLCKQKDA